MRYSNDTEFGREIRSDEQEAEAPRKRSLSAGSVSNANKNDITPTSKANSSSNYHRGIRGMGFACERYVDIDKPLLCQRLWLQMYQDQDHTNDDVNMDINDKDAYKSYLQDYAKLYLQNFLNAHLDDEFFFQQYSPLEHSNVTQKSNNRRISEASTFQKDYEAMRARQSSLEHNSNDAMIQLTLHSYESKFSMITFIDVPCHISDAMIENTLQNLGGAADGQVLIVLSTLVRTSSRRLKRNVYALTNQDGITDALARKDDLEIRADSIPTVSEDIPKDRFHICIGKIRAPLDAGVVSSATVLTLPPSALSDMASAVALKTKLTTLSLMIARALDAKLNLDHGIDSILVEQEVDVDLEVVAAYLRRVHYFDISHGRQMVLIDILSGDGLSGGVLSVEKLSQSLNEIMSSSGVGGENTDELSLASSDTIESIRQAEQLATVNFLSAHTLVSDNNRARCAFRYCAKLFKSVNFLEKHLMKKHSPELRREKLKVHDTYIMQRWENDSNRRCLPYICIDCGHEIGFREVPVTGTIKELSIEDPEPQLRAQYEEALQKRREQQNNYHSSDRQVYNKAISTTVVDVDDMVDEKVELQFVQADADVVTAVFSKKRKSGGASRKKRKKLAM